MASFTPDHVYLGGRNDRTFARPLPEFHQTDVLMTKRRLTMVVAQTC